MTVPSLNYMLLFVDDPSVSADFYSQLLALKPVKQSPTFVLFALPNQVMLGLWSRHTARPKVTAEPGSCEICFEDSSVEVLYEKWLEMGVPIALEPTMMDGMSCTFVALDPDGHRIRVFRLES